MMRSLRSRAAWLLLASACSVLSAGRARASYEEFSTLNVGREEEDDENLLDHVLVEPPQDWFEEWERATRAFRTSQGCFTSSQWYLDHELKVQVPMGDTTYLNLVIRDVSDDESTYGWTQFDLRFPVAHAGLWGLRLRPTFDKSRQDLGFMWDHGTDTTPLQIQAVMGMEDIFNKFWALRQVRVGEDSEPYLRHPYEPALRVVWRGGGPRFETSVKWLTPSRKQFVTIDPALRRIEDLWGEKSTARLSQHFGDYVGAVNFEMVQASSFAYWEQQAGDHHQYSRRWRGEGSLTRPVGEHGRLSLRYFYQERTQVWRPPLANVTLGVIDRMPMVEGSFRAKWNLGMRVGFMRNRVTVAGNGGVPTFINAIRILTFGTRVETRAFFSLQKQFGRVRIQGTEGIELDHEIYPVTFHHDKGFIQLQTTF
jgi:hypothetical protein